MSSDVVLITGALTGIGRATALAYAVAGASLVISGRHQSEGEDLAALLRKDGNPCDFVKADVRREEDVRALVDHAASRFGRVDIAVNNAGTEGTPGPIYQQLQKATLPCSIPTSWERC